MHVLRFRAKHSTSHEKQRAAISCCPSWPFETVVLPKAPFAGTALAIKSQAGKHLNSRGYQAPTAAYEDSTAPSSPHRLCYALPAHTAHRDRSSRQKQEH
eukprot:6202236-Pleurochrysis_carterae.AAC.1